jgi:orotate phosphoribosyltransferase-like protein
LQYTENSGTDVDSIVGIALNGVPLFSGISELGMDAYSPKSYNGVSAKSIVPDFCMGDT